MAKKLKAKKRKAIPTKKRKSKLQIKKEAQQRYYQTLFDAICHITPRIADILKNNYATRDDDSLLIFTFWKTQGITDRTQAKTIQKLLIAGLLAKPETIRRTRQQLQEDHKELRGDLYDERHESEKKMRKQKQMKFNF